MPRQNDRRWTDIAAGPRPILVEPLGSCEQHGPHLPLDTDTRIAVHLAERAAAAVSGVMVTPPLTITASGEHQGFPGTLSIGTEALTTVIVELVRSADWADGVVLVNGHGGNVDAVTAAVRLLIGEGRRVRAWWPSVPGGDAHAGRTETSILLHLEPSCVDLTMLAPGATAPLAELADQLRRGGVRAVSPSGVLGDPTGARADEGAQLTAALVDALVADMVHAIGEWRAAG